MSLLNMMNCSARTELENLFQLTSSEKMSFDTITASAFSQARHKFSEEAFIELNRDCILNGFYSDMQVKRWHGFRLLAIDGTLASLPPQKALFDEFGKQCPQARLPCARVSQLCDVLNNLTVDARISPFATGERELAYQHMASMVPGDLVLYDRGYECHWLLSEHTRTETDFCIRLSVGFNSQVREFVRAGKKQAVVDLEAPRDKVPAYQDKDIPTSPVRLRLVRVVLNTGEVEVLATSLCNTKAYPHSFFKALYHERWGVEEDFKLCKSRAHLENFSGLSPLAVRQDIHALVVSKNMASLWRQAAQPLADQRTMGLKRAYRINFSYVLARFKGYFIRCLTGLTDINDFSRLLAQLASSTHAVRPGRAFERRPAKNAKWKHSMGYKPAF